MPYLKQIRTKWADPQHRKTERQEVSEIFHLNKVNSLLNSLKGDKDLEDALFKRVVAQVAQTSRKWTKMV